MDTLCIMGKSSHHRISTCPFRHLHLRWSWAPEFPHVNHQVPLTDCQSLAGIVAGYPVTSTSAFRHGSFSTSLTSCACRNPIGALLVLGKLNSFTPFILGIPAVTLAYSYWYPHVYPLQIPSLGRSGLLVVYYTSGSEAQLKTWTSLHVTNTFTDPNPCRTEWISGTNCQILFMAYPTGTDYAWWETSTHHFLSPTRRWGLRLSFIINNEWQVLNTETGNTCWISLKDLTSSQLTPGQEHWDRRLNQIKEPHALTIFFVVLFIVINSQKMWNFWPIIL